VIEELATVTVVAQKTITITSQIKSSCSGCAQVDTCGSGQIAKAIPQRQLTLTLPYPKNLGGRSLNVGDCIILGLPENNILASAGQVYLLPLSGLIVSSALGQWLVNQHVLEHELLAFGIGLIGGYLGYRLAKYRQTQGKQSLKLQPQILRVLPAKNAVTTDEIITKKR